jgi:hypothetical protein
VCTGGWPKAARRELRGCVARFQGEVQDIAARGEQRGQWLRYSYAHPLLQSTCLVYASPSATLARGVRTRRSAAIIHQVCARSRPSVQLRTGYRHAATLNLLGRGRGHMLRPAFNWPPAKAQERIERPAAAWHSRTPLLIAASNTEYATGTGLSTSLAWPNLVSSLIVGGLPEVTGASDTRVS